MAHPSQHTIKVRLLGICPSCKERRLREERMPIEEKKSMNLPQKEKSSPEKEEVKVFCPSCGFKQKTEIRNIRNS